MTGRPTPERPSPDRAPARLLAVSPTGLRSGAEVVLRDYLLAAAAAGTDVRCLRPEGPFDVELTAVGIPGGRIPELKLPDGPKPLAALRLLGRVLRGAVQLRRAVRDAEVVVVNSPFALPIVRLARVRPPVVWIVHDVFIRPTLARLIRPVRGGVTRAVAVSEAAAVFPRSIRIPTTVVPNGVLVPDEPEPAPETDAPPIVGINAAITPWKGHRVFLEAMARLPDATAEVMGGAFPKDRAYEQELRARAAEPDLAGRVRFLGHVADPATVMRRWTVAVNASVEPEAGPLSVLEAMALGLAVVATDHGGAHEILAPGGCGTLVPPGDAAALAAGIRGLLDDPAARAATGASGRARVLAHYRAEVSARRFLALLATLVAEAAAGTRAP
jgi:glycosyltransferase involved in cell wall biosynthesis